MNRVVLLLSIVLAFSSSCFAQHWLGAPQKIDGLATFIADFDGDGDADYVRANTGLALQGTVTVVLNDGNGQFSDGPQTALLSDESSVRAVGDFTGDGVQDLAVVSSVTSIPFGPALFIHPGLGGGNFGTPVFIPMEGGVLDLATGDINNDGREDLAVLNFDSGIGMKRLRWFVGTFGNVFNASVGLTFAAFGGPYAIEVLDVNGDGTPDIVGADEPPALQLFPTLGGAVTSGASVLLPLGSLPRMSLGDFNGDGLVDVFSHNSVVGGIDTVVALNGGTQPWTVGALTFFPEVALGPIFHADWDNDGDQDAFVRGSPDFGGDYSLLVNDGAGLFSLAFNRRMQGTANGGAGFADLDQDGFVDFIGANEIWFGDGSTADPAPRLDTYINRLADFDGDNDIDIIGDRGEVCFNDGRGEFEAVDLGYPVPGGMFLYDADVMVEDFDDDGIPDYLVEYLESPGIFQPPIFIEMRLLRGTVQGPFVDAGAVAAPGARMEIRDGRVTPFVDIDGDGDKDLLAANGIWRMNTPGQFDLPLDAYPGWRPIDAADLDGDGDVDILAYTASTPFGVAILRHDGALNFTPEILAMTGLSSEPQGNITRLRDLDDDGDLDVAFDYGISGATTIEIAENLGASFASAQPLASPQIGDTTIDAGDVDGDGLTDLFVKSGSSFGPTLYVYRRIGPGLTYEAPRAYFGAAGDYAVDIDHDGDVDLLDGTVTFNREHFGLAGGSSRQYGEGSAGSGGLVPLLSSTGPFRPGDLTRLRLRHGLGGATSILLAGPAESNLANTPFPGSTLLVSPVTEFFYLTLAGGFAVPGAGTLDIPYVVPTFFAGLSLYLQVAILDIGGASPLTMSNGVEANFGL